MTHILTAGTASGHELWAIVPHYTEFEKDFPVCIQHLKAFCALPESWVTIMLLSPNGLTDADQLVSPFAQNRAHTTLCERLAQSFVGPALLRRMDRDGYSDYFNATKEGFYRVTSGESDRLEKILIAAGIEV